MRVWIEQDIDLLQPFVDAASHAPTHVLPNVILGLSLSLDVDNRMLLPRYEQAEAAKLTSVHTSSPVR